MERRAERQINSRREKWPWVGVGGLIFFFKMEGTAICTLVRMRGGTRVIGDNF